MAEKYQRKIEGQLAAGIHLNCRDDGRHECTAACHVYGFHDLRRAFATVNEETLTANALQRLMRHKSFTATQRYINMAQMLKRSTEKIFVPDVLRRTSTG